MIEAGTKAPEFSLPDDVGTARTLGSLLVSGPLVLYFYPADFTPGCTKEACSIRDLHGELDAAGLSVAGISPQDPDSHRRFREHYSLPYPLLSDPDKTVIRKYGVDGPLGIGVRRVTCLIAPDRTILDSVIADFRIGRHEAFIRNAIAALSRA